MTKKTSAQNYTSIFLSDINDKAIFAKAKCMCANNTELMTIIVLVSSDSPRKGPGQRK